MGTWPGYPKPEDFIVDVGVITVGGVAAAWSATVDGLQFDPGKEVRMVEFDGKSSDIEGMHRTIRYKAKLSGKIKRNGPDMMLDFEPGSESDGSSGSNGNTITLLDARSPWQAGDYLTDVYYIGRQQDLVMFRVYMPRAVVVSYKLATKDNDEATWDVEIAPVLPADETNLNLVPFVYQYVEES